MGDFLSCFVRLKTVLTFPLSGHWRLICRRVSETMDLERDFNIATPSYGHLSTKMHSLVVIELLYASTSRIGIRIGWSVYLLLIDVGCYKAECNLEISILSLRRHYKSFSFLISEETELPQDSGRVFRILELEPAGV